MPDDYVTGSGAPDSPLTQTPPPSTSTTPTGTPHGVQGVQLATGPPGARPIVFINDPTDRSRSRPNPGFLGRRRPITGWGASSNFTQERSRSTFGDFTGGLKDLATEVPEVQATLVDAYATWVENADFDGFRIDTIKHVQHEFWQVFTKNIRARLAPKGKNNFIMFGEAFDGDDQLLGSFTKPGEARRRHLLLRSTTRAFQQVFSRTPTTRRSRPGPSRSRTCGRRRPSTMGRQGKQAASGSRRTRRS